MKFYGLVADIIGYFRCDFGTYYFVKISFTLKRDVVGRPRWLNMEKSYT
jgi:hypothetical protein